MTLLFGDSGRWEISPRSKSARLWDDEVEAGPSVLDLSPLVSPRHGGFAAWRGLKERPSS